MIGIQSDTFQIISEIMASYNSKNKKNDRQSKLSTESVSEVAMRMHLKGQERKARPRRNGKRGVVAVDTKPNAARLQDTSFKPKLTYPNFNEDMRKSYSIKFTPSMFALYLQHDIEHYSLVEVLLERTREFNEDLPQLRSYVATLVNNILLNFPGHGPAVFKTLVNKLIENADYDFINCRCRRKIVKCFSSGY